jgi:hypothetical protein
MCKTIQLTRISMLIFTIILLCTRAHERLRLGCDFVWFYVIYWRQFWPLWSGGGGEEKSIRVRCYRPAQNLDQRLLATGEWNTQRGLGNIQHGWGNTQHGLGNIQHGLGNIYHGVANTHYGLGNIHCNLGNIQLFRLQSESSAPTLTIILRDT